MTEKIPKVSIGLAVYNGERYLEQAVDSILAQTFTDFELIISDNASTDRTQEICQKYAAIDPRIRYHRNPTNIGGANNENLTFKISRGQFFRWAAHDDFCAPELIEKCLEVLDHDPTVVLCHSTVIAVDENGNFMGTMSSDEGTSEKPHIRFRQLASNKHKCEATYGLIRSDVMRKSQLQLNYTGSDRAFLCELGFFGRFKQIPEPLFYKRFHPKNMFLDWRGRMAWFNPSIEKEGRLTFPSWQDFRNYLGIIHRAPISLYEKFLSYLWMGPWIIVNGKRMLKDVVVALYMLPHSRDWRKQRYARSNNWS
jgi:glycosyltransferase involved in cell wall biosynthesis